MNSLIATIKLDIGLGAQNPAIRVYSHTDIEDEVNNFISRYELPSNTFNPILHQINKELQKYKIELKKSKQESMRASYGFIVDGKQNKEINYQKQQAKILPYSPIQLLKKQEKKLIQRNPAKPVRSSLKPELIFKKERNRQSLMTFASINEYRLRRMYRLSDPDELKEQLHQEFNIFYVNDRPLTEEMFVRIALKYEITQKLISDFLNPDMYK